MAVPSVAWAVSGAGVGSGWLVAGVLVAVAAGLVVSHVRAGREAAARAAERDGWGAWTEEQVAWVRSQSWEWLRRYKAATAQGRTDFAGVLRAVERGEVPVFVVDGAGREPDDPFHAVELLISRAWQEAAAEVIAVARRRKAAGEDVVAGVAPRLRGLVSRALAFLDDLERDVEDPDLLAGLFRVDHVTTLARRFTDSLLVLGGRPLPAGRAPVLVSTVLRSAIAETPDFSRARAAWPREAVAIAPHAGHAVIHLLAALVENALSFSNDRVLVTAERVTAGLAVEVEDRGLGMLPEQLERANRLLSEPGAADVRSQLADGRIGLLVTALLARQHGIHVELRRNLLGGTTAMVILPDTLLVTTGPELEAATAFPPPPGTEALVGDTPAPDLPPFPTPAGQDTHEAVPDGPQGACFPPTPPGPEAPGGPRPVLPQRTRQEHPSTPAAGPAALESDRPPNTRLMGAFSAGLHGHAHHAAADEGNNIKPENSPFA
jgi:signal transduction histidine kinase